MARLDKDWNFKKVANALKIGCDMFQRSPKFYKDSFSWQNSFDNAF